MFIYIYMYISKSYSVLRIEGGVKWKRIQLMKWKLRCYLQAGKAFWQEGIASTAEFFGLSWCVLDARDQHKWKLLRVLLLTCFL